MIEEDELIKRLNLCIAELLVQRPKNILKMFRFADDWIPLQYINVNTAVNIIRKYFPEWDKQ